MPDEMQQAIQQEFMKLAHVFASHVAPDPGALQGVFAALLAVAVGDGIDQARFDEIARLLHDFCNKEVPFETLQAILGESYQSVSQYGGEAMIASGAQSVYGSPLGEATVLVAATLVWSSRHLSYTHLTQLLSLAHQAGVDPQRYAMLQLAGQMMAPASAPAPHQPHEPPVLFVSSS